jgi:predicted dehydrogenase
MGIQRINRRSFLQTAAVASAPLILSARTAGANDKIGIGYLGCGRRMRALLNIPEAHAEVVALADVNLDRLKDLQRKYKDAKIYQDYRELLQDPRVDVVMVASPDHWHAQHSVDAMRAGKDVYVEKPMTLTIREGRIMVDVARETDRIVQVGSQQRSMEENRFGCELVRNGRLGELKLVHGSNYPSPWDCPLPEEEAPEEIDWDMWCGPTEPRGYHKELYLPRVRGHEAGWISYTRYSGGEMTGWGAHGLDQILWALGKDESGPKTIEPLLDQVPKADGVHMGPTCQVKFTFDDGTDLILDDVGPGGGGVFDGSEGKIMITRGKWDAKGDVDTSEIPADGVHLRDVRGETLFDESRNSDSATARHIGNWLYCVRERKRPAADVAIGHRSTTMCHLGNIARWTERKLTWDPETERFENDDEANAMLDRERRGPWKLEA